MVMGSTGMAMGNMEMPAPDNTLPMMTGTGQFGPIEMGGMFTVMKIREDLARDDYRDPGPYQYPARHRRLRGRLARGRAGAAAGLADAQDEDVSVSMNHELETTMKKTIKLASR